MNSFLFSIGILVLFLQGMELWEMKGRSFMIMLPGDGKVDAQAFITIFGNEWAAIEFTIQDPMRSLTGIIDSSGIYNRTFSTGQQVNIRADSRCLKAVHVTSNDSIAVNVITTWSSMAISYNAIPDISGFYFNYRVVTHCPENTTCNSVIAIVGIINSLNIIVTIKTSSTVTIDGSRYDDGDSLHVFVEKQEILLLRCKGDITGTKVYTLFQTNVFSGSYCEDEKGAAICDVTFEQVPPVRLWGSTFSLTPFPNHVYGFYRLVADNTDTVVTDNGVTLTTLQAGEFLDVKYVSEVHNVITSSPIQVVMFVSHSSQPEMYPSAMIILQPSLEERRYYQLMSPERYTSYCQMAGKFDFSIGAWLNDKYLCGYNVDKTVYGMDTNVSTVYINIPYGTSIVGSDVGEFGSVVYGFRNQSGYGYSGIPRESAFPPSENCSMQPSIASPLLSYSTESVSNLARKDNIMSSTVSSERSTYILDSPSEIYPPLTTRHLETETLVQSVQDDPSHVTDVSHLMLTPTGVISSTDNYFSYSFDTSEESTTMDDHFSASFDTSEESTTTDGHFSNSLDTSEESTTIIVVDSSEVSSELLKWLFVEEMTPDEIIPSGIWSPSLISDYWQQITTFQRVAISSPFKLTNTAEHPSTMKSDRITALSYSYNDQQSSDKTTDALKQELQSEVHGANVHLLSIKPTSLSETSKHQMTSKPSVLVSSQTVMTTSTLSRLCPCNCWMRDLSEDELLSNLDIILQAVRKNLTLDKDTLSVSVRKRISVSDSRKTAAGIGAFGTSILVLLFVLFVLGDVVSPVLILFGRCKNKIVKM